MKFTLTEKEYRVEVGTGPDKLVVYGVPPTQTEFDALRRKHTTRSFKRGVPFEDTNWVGFGRDRAIKAFRRWENAKDDDGNEMPCDAEHISAVYERYGEVIAEVMEKLDAAKNEDDQAEEADRQD